MLNKSAIATVLGAALLGTIKNKGSRSVEPNIKDGTFSPESMDELVAVAKDPVLNPTIHRIWIDGWEMGEIEGLSDEEIESRVRDIPDEIILFENLESLHAEYLNVSKLPHNLNSLRKLKKLNLSENKFTSIPNNLAGMNLESIDLSHNEISHLNASDLALVGNDNTKINLSYCKIERLPEDFVSTLGSRIEKINLDGNLGLIRSPVEYLLKLLDSGFPVDLFLKTFRPENSDADNQWYYYYSSFRYRENLSFFMAQDIHEFSKDPVWLATRTYLEIRFKNKKRSQEIDYSKRQSLMNEVLIIVTKMKRLKTLRLSIPSNRRSLLKPDSKKTNVILPNSISSLTHLKTLQIYNLGTVVIPPSAKGLHQLYDISFYNIDKIVGLHNLKGIETEITLRIECKQINFEELYSLSNVTKLSIENDNLILPEGIDSMNNLGRLSVPYVISIPDSILNLNLSVLHIEADPYSSDWRKKTEFRIPHPIKIMQAVEKGFNKNIAKNMIRVYSEIPVYSQLRKF